MAYNGSGTFTRLYNWVTDRTNSIKIRADRMDAEMDGFASGLSNAICKDGQTTLTGDIPFSNRKLTGLGNATLAADAMNQQTSDVRYQKRPSTLTTTAAFDDTDVLGLFDSTTTNDLGISGANFRTDLLSRLRANGDIFATGGSVAVVFRMNAAPTGWTKLTYANDRALRVVSGSLVDGGSSSFSVAFPAQTPSGTVGNTALNIGDLAVHSHSGSFTGSSPYTAGGQTPNLVNFTSAPTGNAGSGSGHTHAFTGNALAAMTPAYSDVIFASKN